MKRIIAVLCLLSSVLCMSAPAAVEILSATQVKVDGSPAGDIVNALRAYPARSAEIVAALDTQLQRASAADNDNVTAVARITLERDALLARLQEVSARVDQLTDALDFVAASSLPGDQKRVLEEARVSKADRRRAELEAQKVTLEAQLAKLDGEPAANAKR